MGTRDWGENVDQIKRDFLRDGCVIIPGFLAREELTELRARTEHWMREHVGGSLAKTRKNLQKDDPWFAEQLTRGRQVGLIETLLEDALEPATAAFFDRVPGASPRRLRRTMTPLGIAGWVPRSGSPDRADQENGCLRYVRGTHKLDLQSRIGLDFDANSEGAIAVEVNPGDAAIHSALTVHWSEPNRSGRSRKAISYFYWAASSKGDGKYAELKRSVKQAKPAM